MTQLYLVLLTGSVYSVLYVTKIDSVSIVSKTLFFTVMRLRCAVMTCV